MHCQSCGNELTAGLSYCPRCGAGQSLVRGANPVQQISPDSLIWAVVVSTVAVLGLILGGIIVLKNNGIGDDLVWTFVAVCLLAVAGVDVMFLRTLHGLRREEKRAIEDSKNGGNFTRRLREGRAQTLEESIPSVTEQTTRSFEEVPLNRIAK